MKRCAFIIPYFGKWPFWFSFFIESCRYNPDYFWVFYTDCQIPDSLPSNISMVRMSLGDYCHKVSKALNIDFYTKNAYKLCDLKPAVGIIHKNDLADSEFFGFCDVDVIFGNINHFVTPEKLEKYDIISAHERRISGHLCLLRNNERVASLFKKIPDWENKIKNEKLLGIDEKDFSDLFVKHKNFPNYLRKLVCKIYFLSRKASLDEAFSTPYLRRPWTTGDFIFPKKWFWKEGKLTTDIDGEEEFAYLHFKYWKDNQWKNNTDKIIKGDFNKKYSHWVVSEYGFHLA